MQHRDPHFFGQLFKMTAPQISAPFKNSEWLQIQSYKNAYRGTVCKLLNSCVFAVLITFKMNKITFDLSRVFDDKATFYAM